MSLIAARKKRTSLYLSVGGLMVMVAAVSAISANDPSGVSLRVGMIMIAVGAGLWLPWRQLIPAVLLTWLAPNLGRSLVDDVSLGSINMILELPGLAGVAFFTLMARDTLRQLEQENLLIGTGTSELAGINPETGIYEESQLRPALSSELARSRRFGRTFSLVLVDVDEMRQKFDYRDDTLLKASHDATTELLRQTRLNVDRVFHYKGHGFAIILPESNEKDIPGMVKRLRRLARAMKPAEGEPGGPMAIHFGATFFPECATAVDDLMRRAEIALRLAASSETRYQLDTAEAPELPPAETLRREPPQTIVASTLATQSPPPISNPVAAAIVGEAYAERAREEASEASAELTTPVLLAEPDPSELVEPGAAVKGPALISTADVEQPELSLITGAIPASEAPEAVSATGVEAELEAPVAIATEAMASSEEHGTLPGMGDNVPEEILQAETPALAVVEEAHEDYTEVPYMPEQEPAPALAPALTLVAPVAESEAVQAQEPVEPEPVAATAEPVDDFEALLAQMDETLKMIKSVRSHAA